MALVLISCQYKPANSIRISTDLYLIDSDTTSEEPLSHSEILNIVTPRTDLPETHPLYNKRVVKNLNSGFTDIEYSTLTRQFSEIEATAEPLEDMGHGL